MTEREWESCADPLPMVNAAADRLSDRQLRLFACACCRRVPLLAGDPPSLAAVEAAEQFADGAISEDELMTAAEAIREACRSVPASADHVRPPLASCRVAAAFACSEPGYLAVQFGAFSGRYFPGGLLVIKGTDAAGDSRARASPEPLCDRELSDERWAQSDLLRCICRGPGPWPELTAAVLAWEGGLVVQLARAAYDDRLLPSGHLHPERLAVLADSLEDAGCTDDFLLAHLRSPRPHVRGCFPVDVVAGRF